MIYKKILVAIDGSDTSKAALQEAIRLANDQKAALQILFVIEENFAFHGGPGFDFSQLIAIYKEKGQQVLNEAKKEAEHASINIETKLIQLNPFQGRVAEIIADEAKAWSADLLVIGTHGRRGVSHLFLGSVAENVIRIATVPVLLIRSK